MTPYGAIVVDDERPARAKVIRLLGEDPRFRLLAEASNGLEALEAIETHRPSLVVLDIQMPGLDGFEVLKAVDDDQRQFALIFTTAHDEHALRAFEAHAIDYLLKPFDARSFHRSLQKAHALLAGGGATLPSLPLEPRALSRLVVRESSGAWTTVEHDAILRISAANKHVEVYTRHGRFRTRLSLRDVVSRLDPERFLQVHRSEVVNLAAVTKLEPWTHGDGILVLADGSTVVVTRTHRSRFLERFVGSSRSSRRQG